MSTVQINGSDVTRSSTNNNGGVFLKGNGSNNAPISSQQNSGFDSGKDVVQGVNTDIAISAGVFANDSRGSIMRATNKIANVNNNFLTHAATNNHDSVRTQTVNSVFSTYPQVKKITKQYSFSTRSGTTKTAEAIRNGKLNIYTGDFAAGYPEASSDYWANLITKNGLCVLDANNSDSYSGSGTTWSDISGGGYNGTLTNGPTFTSGSNTSPASFEFDGSDDYVETGLSYAGTADYTMGIWIKTPYAQKCGLIGHRSSWGGDQEIAQSLIYITGDKDAGSSGRGFGMWEWRALNNNWSRTEGNFLGRSQMYLDRNICDDKWHNIVVVKQRFYTRVYLDGLPIGENSSGSGKSTTNSPPETIPIGTDTRFVVGAAGNGVAPNNLGGFYYHGSIAQTYFYAKAFSDQIVANNYYSFKERHRIQ